MKMPSSGERHHDDRILARPRRSSEAPLRRTLRAVLYALLLLVAWSAAFIFYPSGGRITVVVGEPSPRNIKAPRQLTYVSEVKTRDARLAAAAQVHDIYTGPDMTIVTRQLYALQDIANYITAIRHDQYASPEKKLASLREIPSLDLPSSVLTKLLEFDEDNWQRVITECSRTLELILRDEIRGYQVADAQQKARRLTSYALPEELQKVVVPLAQSMVVPNSFYDAKQTLATRDMARSAVEPVHWTLREGESILREGEIVTDLAMEKLQVLGLLDTGRHWQDVLGILLFALVLIVPLSLYVARSQILLLSRPRRELLLALMLMVVGVMARILIPDHTLIPYLFPAATVAMLVTILLDLQLAMVVSAVVAILVGFSAGGSLELVVYAFVGSMIGALTIWHADHLGSFARTSVYLALTNVTVVLAFRLYGGRSYDMTGLVQLTAMSVGNALLSSSLALVAFAFIGRIFGIATSFQLLDLARPTHPLFRQLLIKAPGTYHHSLIVSNMAERAAEAVGADALLVRVGSYYHDVGKIDRPYFFAENQGDGVNPHDKLDPKTSTEIIIAHTTDGLELAHKYGLPDRVADFIPEHHGTNLVSYFYQRAVQEHGKANVREAAFRYPGPKPQSRETAIVMLADCIEASVRANHPPTQAEMERLIYQAINDRLLCGELDECDLTLRDLDQIRDAFVGVLQGVFHPRIQYPETAQPQAVVENHVAH